MRLLAHVAFFDAGSTPTAGAGTSSTASSSAGGATGKTSAFWRTFNFNAVTLLLAEMEVGYTAFRRVDAVIDVNPKNAFQEQLRNWRLPLTDTRGAGRVWVQVVAHYNLSHPFRTTWAHRAHMQGQLERYDWFLYTEADVFVPGTSVLEQTRLALPLYARRQKPLGFTRMVNDTAGRLFFSDIRRPVTRSSVFSEPGLGAFAPPDNSYAAAWMYPQLIMREFIRSRDWLPVLRTIHGMRERAGRGWGSAGIVVRVDDPAPLRVFHVGKSGVFYNSNRRGFNTLPAQKLLPDGDVRPPDLHSH
jgi:hypothetical protein